MIVDTSALFAIVRREPGWETLSEAIYDGEPSISASTLTELQLVAGRRSDRDTQVAEALVNSLIGNGLNIIAFGLSHAIITGTARKTYGKGNGKGGLLNFGDLMVYAVAKERGEPLLFTGRDFASTDLVLHPASRLEP